MSQMVIDGSVRDAGTDPIFRIAGEANKRVAEVGAENVINSTLGALLHDDGSLVCFETVYTELKNLPDDAIANYAGITGIPSFLEKVKDACFKTKRPDGFIESVATPGGTGAVRHAIRNYSNEGDSVLIPDWHWAPYQTIADENNRHVKTFPLFDDDGHFNIPAHKKTFLELMKAQNGRVLVIHNTPAHNPTGYSIKDGEWDELIDFYKNTALNDPESKIIILCDIAYIDFAGQGDDAREFMLKLSKLPENILVLYAFSASKSYTMYGLRNGALICVAPTEAIASEFVAACSYSNRGTWSNGTRGAMETLANIQLDTIKRDAFDREQNEYRNVLQERAKIFLKEADKIGLKLCNYDDGFFISIPCNKPMEISEILMDKNLFIVALGKGLRFAPCAVSAEKCSKAPSLILEAIREHDVKE